MLTNTHKTTKQGKFPNFEDHHVSLNRYTSTLLDCMAWIELFIIGSIHVTSVTGLKSKKKRKAENLKDIYKHIKYVTMSPTGNK